MKKLIVGLGNKGNKYQNTRHNTGFIIVDELAKDLDWKENTKFKCLIAQDSDCIFIKPLTYMNGSGFSVKKTADYYNVETKNIYIVHDDADLNFADTRYHFGRGSGGHHGIDSIVEHLGTNDFWRVRVGIGRPEINKFNIEDWVLRRLSADEIKKLSDLSLEINKKILKVA